MLGLVFLDEQGDDFRFLSAAADCADRALLIPAANLCMGKFERFGSSEEISPPPSVGGYF